MKTNVIFDTNAYRNLTLKSTISEIEDKLKKIRMAEAEKGITVHLSIIVLTELLNHLSKNEQNLKKRNDCLNGLIASIFHGRNQILEIDKYKPSLNNIVLQDVFGIIDEKEKFYNDCVIEVSNRIVIEILNSKTIEQIQDVLEIADAIEINHKNCIENRKNDVEIFTKIIKGFNPDVNLEKSKIGNQEFYKSLTKGSGLNIKLSNVMAETYLQGTIQFFKQYNLSVTQNHTEKFIGIYKSAIMNIQEFFKKFNNDANFTNDYKHKEIWNDINDTHLLMNSYIKDEKVILVTHDKKMKYEESDIFKKMELNEYLRYLDY
ncbi:MAG: hypothetical protein IPN09_00645 [Bacteroidetes bacterium]|nr:hypothetical protein [Bacteroidota bacterium]